MKTKKKNHKVAFTIGGLIIIVALIYIFLNICPQSVILTAYDPILSGVTPSGSSVSSIVSTGGEGPESIGFSALSGANCPSSHPKYCSNVGFCYEDWVSCETLEYCNDGYYGCGSGDQLICYHGDAYCFDECVNEDTVAECGGGMHGCWIEGCDGKTGSIPYCIEGQYHCCPSQHPIYNLEHKSCWGEGWDCISDSDCAIGQICENHNCIDEIKCPVCPAPSEWSECILGQMTRTKYTCGEHTNYQCYAGTEKVICGSACPVDITIGKPIYIKGDVRLYDLNYNCQTAPIEEAFGSIMDIVESIWYYDGVDWHVYSTTGAPSDLDTAICGEEYTIILTEKEGIFRCPEAAQPVCGDGVCEGTEDMISCPLDCVVQPICGNGICEAGENYLTCPMDCQLPPGQICGDGVCEGTEDMLSCPKDCITTTTIIISLMVVLSLMIIYYVSKRK